MQSKRPPLEDLRVITVEQYGAGPYGSKLLADLGADVIKIEAPIGGDISRATGPYFLGEHDSQFFQTFNLGKRSLRLDLKTTDGKKVLHDLVSSADAVMNNLRGDQSAKLGLDYQTLSAIKPSIVCAHLSAYGRDNPRASWPGYDYLMQAEAGFMSLTGEPDGPPARFGLSIVDFMSGTILAVGLLAAIHGAKRDGVGRDVDVSLFDVALHQLSYPATWYLNSGHETTRLPRSAHPGTVPCQLYRAADGWLMVMCMLDKFWHQFADGIGRADLLVDPRFANAASRRDHRDALTEQVDIALGAHSCQHWLTHFQGRIPIAPVHDVATALDSDFVRDLGMTTDVAHPHGRLRTLSTPFRLDGARPSMRACAALGADARALLSELGYTETQIADLSARAVI